MLRNLFSEKEVAGILSLPISSLGMKDRLIWKHTPHGQFSVKSGYKITKEKRLKETREEGSSIKADDERKLWGEIWVLNVKSKV